MGRFGIRGQPESAVTVSYDSTWAPPPKRFMSWTIRLQYYEADGVIKQIGWYKVVRIEPAPKEGE